MADIQSDIQVNIDTSGALANLKQLQTQISAFHTSMAKGGAAAANASLQLQQNLVNSINATGKFAASFKTVVGTTEAFTTALEKNQFSMKEYFRYTGAATKTFGRLFKEEFDTIGKVARDRVKDLQTQYIKLGRDANGAIKTIAIKPLALDMKDFGTQTAIAAQKQQILNQLLKQGSTNLLNFGKNTQWAGRQLMVGFTVPLAMVGTQAAKTFMAMEEQAIRFKRVYGEMFTTQAETDKMLKSIQQLAKEFTKYGVAVEKTMEMAASAAASGKMGADLMAQITEATRLAVLGNVEQAEALETTISLTNAFGVSADQLANKINFLNAVENQTVVSIEDLTTAIPKAGPVIEQLGGSVEDLAFFLTAMKEGGINAAEGANALKSGLASMINPSKKASEFLATFGVNLNGIVEANKGDVKGTVVGFAQALDKLDPLNRSRAIEQLFGKFQFARISTLFKNVVAQGSQASRVLELTKATTEELAILSERELSRIEESPMYKFKKTIEDLKVSLAPIGEQFLKAITPIVGFVGKILEKFNGLGDGTKKFVVMVTTLVAGLGPVLLMTFGLLANGIANIIKGFAAVKGIFNRTGGASRVLGEQTDYMSQAQLEAAGVAASLDQTHSKLIQTFTSEAGAIENLTNAYMRAIAQQRAFTAGNVTAGPTQARYASGIISVPGPKGAGDIVPAMLSPGEAVVPAKFAAKYPALTAALVTGNVPGHMKGTKGSQSQRTAFNVGGESYGLMLDPRAKGAGEDIQALVTAVEDGSLGIANGSEVLEEVFVRLADSTKVNTKEFLTELRIVTEHMRGMELPSRQVNEATGRTDKNNKLAGHSQSEAEGPNKTVKEDMYDAGQGAEHERMQSVSDEASRKFEKDYPDLPGFQKNEKTGHTQLDRGHVGEIGSTAKGTAAGWFKPFWDESPHPENELSQTLADSADVRGVYLDTLKNLDESSATPDEIASITKKIESNGVLNERELQVQRVVLEKMLANKAFMKKQISEDPIENKQAKKAYKEEDGRYRTGAFEKTALQSIYVAKEREAQPRVLPEDPRSPEERLAAGWVDVKKRYGKNNPGGPGSDFAPFEENERKATLEKIKVPLEVSPADEAKAAKEGAKVGQAAIDGASGPEGADNKSPSKKGKKIGKDIADGLIVGMQEKEAEVSRQSSQLGDAAVPSAAETQSKMEKMDITNKAFYDDLDTEETRDLRQSLKSQDRNRRKRGQRGTVDSQFASIGGARSSGSSSSTQISVTNNSTTVNQEQENADKLNIEAAKYEQIAAKARIEAAKWKEIAAREGGKNIYTADNAAALDKQASIAEEKAARLRLEAEQASANAASKSKDSTEQTGKLVDKVNGSLKEEVVARDKAANSAETVANKTQEQAASADDAAKATKKSRSSYRPQGAPGVPSDSETTQSGAKRTRGQRGSVAKQGPAGKIVAEKVNAETRKKKAQQEIVDKAHEEALKENDARDKAKTEKAKLDAQAKMSQSMGKLQNGLMVASSMAAMGSAVPGKVGEVSRKVVGPLMTMTSILPMLQTRSGQVTFAILATVAAIVKMRMEFDKAQKTILETAEKFRESSQAILSIAKFGGKVTASEIMDKRREAANTKLGSINGKTTYGEAYAQTKEGKSLIANITKVMGEGKASQAEGNLQQQLLGSVQSGAMTVAQARSLAMQVATQAGDQGMGIRITATLEKILGPNGERLDREPLKVRMEMIAENNKKMQSSLKDVGRADPITKLAGQKTMQIGGTIASALGGAAAGAGIGAAIGGTMSGPLAPIVAPIGAALGAAIGAGVAYFGSKKFVKKAATLGAAAMADANIALQENKQILDSFDLYYQKKVEELKLQGKINEAFALNVKYHKERNKLVSEMGQTNQAVVTGYNKAGGLQESMMVGARKAVTARYKNDPNQIAYTDLVGQQAGDLQKKGLISSGQEYLIQMKMASGEISPQQMRIFMDLATSNEKLAPVIMKMMVKFSGSTNSSAADAANSILDEKGNVNPNVQTTVLAKISAQKTDSDAMDMVENLQEITRLGEVIPADFIVDILWKDPKRYAELNRVMDMINEKKPKTADVVFDILPQLKGTENFDEKYFETLTSDQKQNYVKAITATIMLSDVEVVGSPDYQRWLKEDQMIDGKRYGGVQYASESQSLRVAHYRSDEAFKITKVTDVAAPLKTGGSTGAGGKIDSSPLDDLLKKLRDLRKAQIDLTKGWSASMKALKGLYLKNGKITALKDFEGLEQKLRKAGLNQGSIDFITGLSPEDYKKYKDKLFEIDKKTGKAKLKDALYINQAINDINLGEFQNENSKSRENLDNQAKAFQKLKEAGVGISDIYTAIENPALADAIANTSKGASAMKTLIADWKEVLKVKKDAAAVQAVRLVNDDVKTKIDTLKKLGGAVKDYSEKEIIAILDNPDLQRLVLDPTLDPAALKESLNNALIANDIDIATKSLTIKGKLEIYTDGFSKAMEKFTANEEANRIKMEVELKPTRDTAKLAEQQIAAANYIIDDYEAGIQRIDTAAEVITESYNKQFEALDRVREINDKISGQQQRQLTLADAITSGDISAAAKAAQDMRAADAQDAIDAQRAAMERERDLAIAKLTDREGITSGLTKLQIQELLKAKQLEIFNIQERTLEPAQEAIRLAEEKLQSDNDSLKVMGKTKLEWDAMQNGLDVAKTNTVEYKEAISLALEVVNDIKKAWEDLDGTNVNVRTLNDIVQKYTTASGPTVAELAAAEAARAKAITDANAATAASKSSSSSSSGGSSSSASSPKSTTPTKPATTTPAPTAPTTPAPGVVPKGYMVNAAIKETLNRGTNTGILGAYNESQIAAQKALNAMVNYKGKDSSGKDVTGVKSNTDDKYQKFNSQSQAEWNKLNDKYNELVKKRDEFTHTESGDPTSMYTGAASEAIRKKTFSSLPQWVKDSVAILNNRVRMVEKDYSAFTKALEAYNKVKADNHMDKLSWSEIAGDKAKLAIVKPSHDAYAQAFNNIKTNNSYIDSVRSQLAKYGYTQENLGWAFEKNSSNSTPMYEGSSDQQVTLDAVTKGNVKYYASGGFVGKRFAVGTDTVPAMLTPGEFIVNKTAVKDFGMGNLKSINSGTYDAGTVYNSYSLTVNAKSDANPNDIAQAVMTQIRQIESQKVRGQVRR